jgi:hypothetical protein
MSSVTLPFKDIRPKLSEKCLNVIDEFGFTETTPVQAATIPLLMSSKDVVVEVSLFIHQPRSPHPEIFSSSISLSNVSDISIPL